MRIQSAAPVAPVASTSVPIDVRLMRSGANVLLALVLLAGLAVLGARLARSPWFNLREIHVEGEVAHNTAESVRANAQAFRAEANDVLRRVYERMQRENREFYPRIEAEETLTTH